MHPPWSAAQGISEVGFAAAISKSRVASHTTTQKGCCRHNTPISGCRARMVIAFAV